MLSSITVRMREKDKDICSDNRRSAEQQEDGEILTDNGRECGRDNGLDIREDEDVPAAVGPQAVVEARECDSGRNKAKQNDYSHIWKRGFREVEKSRNEENDAE